MAEFPMFPLWTDAYLADTAHLSTVEHGAYLLLLMTMWRSKTKRLPNDDKMLARYTRLTVGQWQRIKPILMPFFDDHGDTISQPRLTDEAESVRQHSKAQSQRAKARWLKNKDSGYAAALPDECPSDAPISISISKKDSPLISPSQPAPQDEIEHDPNVIPLRGQPPTAAPPAASARSKPASTRRGTRIPKNWQISNEGTQYAQEHGMSAKEIIAEAEQFHDHWLASSKPSAVKRDWDAAWRTWVRNWTKWNDRSSNSPFEAPWGHQTSHRSEQYSEVAIARQIAARRAGLR